MSLFGKTEINPKILPFVQRGEGVGVVKVEGYSKASVRLQSDEILFDAYDGSQIPAINLNQITELCFIPGNFINEPKFDIGLGARHFILKGVDDNDTELERFYNTILNLKQRQQRGRQNGEVSNQGGMPKPNRNITNPNKQQNFSDMQTQQEYIPSNQDVDNTQYIQSEPSEYDPVSEIRRYYELKEDGIISEEEFEEKKKQLLNL